MSTPNVLVPLYIYPSPGAWDTLYEALETHLGLHFTIIINPGNGPGPEALPDSNYVTEIPRLRSYANAEVLGYVHISYGNRDLDAVKRDVGVYSAWASNELYPGVAVDGIFVDETPYEESNKVVTFLADLRDFVKLRCPGLGGDKMIIHNPGCVPARVYMDLADLTIIFEDSFENFRRRLRAGVFDLQRAHQLNVQPSNVGMIIHSIPASVPEAEILDSIKQVRGLARSIFVTECNQGFYEAFSPKWREWVKLIGQ